MPFVKLDCGILNSTLWFDKPIRDVFLTALLMAEPRIYDEPVREIQPRALEYTGWEAPPGLYGFVAAAGVGIFARAHVPDDQGFGALESLARPEPTSRSQEFEGRRMIRVDGGFVILNYGRYRERDYTAADRSRRYRERLASRRSVTPPRRDITQAEAEAEAEAEADKQKDQWRREVRAAKPRQSNHTKSLIGTHHRCPEGTWAACERGVCVPAKLYAEWRAQFADFDEAVRSISAFVDRTVASFPAGPIGDSPFDLWRASWRAEHASRAPSAPNPHSKGAQTVANVQRALARLRAEGS